MSKRGVKKRLLGWSSVVLLLLSPCLSWIQVLEAACVPSKGCSVALVYYQLLTGDTLDEVADRFQSSSDDVMKYNVIPNPNSIPNGTYVLFPFPCQCQDQLLGYSFLYQVRQGDTVQSIAQEVYEGLTAPEWIAQASSLQNVNYILPGNLLRVPVNCSCGNLDVSADYGLFATYAATNLENASTLSTKFNVSQDLLQKYNPTTNWQSNLLSNQIIFIPAREANGVYPPYNSSDNGSGGTSAGLVVGLSVGGGLVFLLIASVVSCLLCFYQSKKRASKDDNAGVEVANVEGGHGFTGSSFSEGHFGSSGGSGISGPSALSEFTVDKSVEFSFEELAAATNNFSVANKIGEGGYGSVYFANLRGQKLAVKRMNLQATREFLAELQVLTHVHHTNLVQLIGYCTVDSLFLIYEYVENGTLDRHLHRSNDLPPLQWPVRVQIALDAARGLEYIHEHTKPSYIHRDVKSSNILIDKQLHAKVADFGLTKLTESGLGSFSLTLPTRLVGTFGYMSPEYARFGDVSPKVDVYSFGVVLFEIISAKEAIVRTSGLSSSSAVQEQRGLVTLSECGMKKEAQHSSRGCFEGGAKSQLLLNRKVTIDLSQMVQDSQPDQFQFEEVLKDATCGKEKLRDLVDPALGNNYPLESAWKMAQLAGNCTQENPELRPSMRTVVVALMTLSSTTQEWEMSAYGSDNLMTALISGR